MISGAINGSVELDEIFIQHSRKGEHNPFIKGKKRGAPANKRGLSNEKYCLITGVNRKDGVFASCCNTAKPTAEDVMLVCDPRIKDKIELITDGLASYNSFAEVKNCSLKVLKDYKDYNSVHHLNTVNSFHNAIRLQIQKYRGFASKYINRYGALFAMQWKYKGCDANEKLLKILKLLRSNISYFTINDITSKILIIH